MSFKFKARVLLELGAELISSDPVALYELIKNSLDAGSKTVEIQIRIAMQYSAYSQLRKQLDAEMLHGAANFNFANFNKKVLDNLADDASPATLKRFRDAYGTPRSASSARDSLVAAYLAGSYILVRDTGVGMSKFDLSSNYLTVGTPTRLLEKTAKIARASASTSRLRGGNVEEHLPLGEKGIGRLSAMRLGHHVRVKTKQKNTPSWNLLVLDWRPAFDDPTLDADALEFPIVEATCDSDDKGNQGTTIYIRDLQSDWSRQKVERIAGADLAKLQNPFVSLAANGFMELSFQGEKVEIPTLDREPLKSADAICTASFTYDSEDRPSLGLHVNYKRFSKERLDRLSGDHLRACVREEPGRRSRKKGVVLVDAEIVAQALEHLGPFKLTFYWFNRGRIQREKPDFFSGTLQPFLAQWGGGFLVYRDGYRVYPYGERSNDWLDLDRKALAASAYKLNRAQMVGELRLTSLGNPSLLDQTNREGFRDSYDREALIRLLRYTILGFCRPFLEEIEREVEPPIKEVVEEVQKRIGDNKEAAVASLRQMRERVPDESATIGKVMNHLEEVNEAWERAKLRIQGFEQTLESYIHLAGVGLMLEFIAHELSRVTQESLRSVASGRFSPAVVEAQLKTLDKRVRILDELSIPGRQIRKEVDVYEAIELLCDFHRAKGERHDVEILLAHEDKGRLISVLERGQLLQIVDNLFSNSFYWIVNQLERPSAGKISIAISCSRRSVTFSDNGPGIPPERKDSIFDQFVTTKPPREGRGLGLYIARRLAEENGATLTLGSADADGLHRTFILAFKK